MNAHWNSYLNRALSRRELLKASSTGFGALALAAMLGEQAHAATAGAQSPLSEKPPQFPARAKRVIFLFMHGGPSQVDTFDYKPLLIRDHGKPLPFKRPKVVSSETFNLLKSPWDFKQYGQSGMWVSDLFPQLSQRVDDICFIKSMWGSNSRHGGALLELHTGSDTFVRPSMGSWITYGLGTENQSMPGFITICPTQSHGGANNYSSGFLPAPYAGTPIGSVGIAARDAKIPFIANPETPRDIQRMELDYLQTMNREQLAATGPDQALEGRIESFELAFRMQSEAPGLQDISKESAATLKLYGIDNPATEDFGRQCLMARRFVRSRRAVRAGEPHVQVGSAFGSVARSCAKCARSRPADRWTLTGFEGAWIAGRHAGAVGRRIWAHADRAGRRRPRSQSARLHDVDGGRRREAGSAVRVHRRLRILFGGEQGPLSRFTRDHSVFAGHGSH